MPARVNRKKVARPVTWESYYSPAHLATLGQPQLWSLFSSIKKSHPGITNGNIGRAKAVLMPVLNTHFATVTPPTTPADQIAQLKADLRDAESRYLGLQVTLRATSSRYQAELADIKAKHAEAMQDIRGEIEDVCKGMEENFEADLNLWALEREALVTKLKEYGWEETDGINGVVEMTEEEDAAYWRQQEEADEQQDRQDQQRGSSADEAPPSEPHDQWSGFGKRSLLRDSGGPTTDPK